MGRGEGWGDLSANVHYKCKVVGGGRGEEEKRIK